MSWNNKEEIETTCSSTVQQHAAARYNNMQQHGTTTCSSTVQQRAAARYNNEDYRFMLFRTIGIISIVNYSHELITTVFN